MKKYKVGMVGVGRGTAYGRIFTGHPDTEVVALCDMNQESLEQNGKEFGLADSCLFEKYEDFLNELNEIVERRIFSYAFKMGSRIAIGTLDD